MQVEFCDLTETAVSFDCLVVPDFSTGELRMIVTASPIGNKILEVNIIHSSQELHE